MEKAREFQKNIYFCFIDYAKAFDCVDHNKLWKSLKEMGISEHLICLLRNLYAGQEATVRTGHGTTDWFQIGKGVRPLVPRKAGPSATVIAARHWAVSPPPSSATRAAVIRTISAPANAGNKRRLSTEGPNAKRENPATKATKGGKST